jgi:hypothetical protein
MIISLFTVKVENFDFEKNLKEAIFWERGSSFLILIHKYHEN